MNSPITYIQLYCLKFILLFYLLTSSHFVTPGFRHPDSVVFKLQHSGLHLGSNITMICEWDGSNRDDKVIEWYRTTPSDQSRVLLWTYIPNGINRAAPGFDGDFELISPLPASHWLKLLYTNEHDEGDYMCLVRIASLIYTSNTRSLSLASK